MTVREVEERLEVIRTIKGNIMTANATIESLRSCLLPSSSDTTQDKVQENHDDKMTSVFAKIELLESEIEQSEDRIKQEALDMVDFIEQISDDKCKSVLNYWYIGGFKPEDISERLGYSINHVYFLRRKAIKDLSDKLNSK